MTAARFDRRFSHRQQTPPSPLWQPCATPASTSPAGSPAITPLFGAIGRERASLVRHIGAPILPIPDNSHNVKAIRVVPEVVFGEEHAGGAEDALLFASRNVAARLPVLPAAARFDFDEHDRSFRSDRHQIEFTATAAIAPSHNAVALPPEIPRRHFLASPSQLGGRPLFRPVTPQPPARGQQGVPALAPYVEGEVRSDEVEVGAMWR